MSVTRVLFVAASLLSLTLVACGDDDASTDADAGAVLDGGGALDGGADSDAGADAGADSDAGADTDAGADSDAGTHSDAGAELDAGTDAGSVVDAGRRDAGDACHAHDFGAGAVPLRMVASLPAMTGGTIPVGTYDAVDAQIIGAVSGSYRATWVFEDATTLQQIQQITLAGPGAIVPRTFTWSTSGNMITRDGTCPDSDSFTNQFTVREEGGETYLDVREGNLMFTFRRR